jgi:hypothetical protein
LQSGPPQKPGSRGAAGADFRPQMRLRSLPEALPGQSGYNEHLAEEGALVFEHACKLGAEVVSKRVDAPYRSGPHSAWIKLRNPASIAVQRERSENWNK